MNRTDTKQKLDVLLLSAGYGDGHHQAARAIEEHIAKICPRCNSEMVDYLNYFPHFIEYTTVGLYKVMSKHSPWAYAGVYHLTSEIAGMWGWSQIEYSIGRRHLRNLLYETTPGAIVCTHPLPMAVLSTMRKQGEHLPPVFGIITDFVLHGEWIQPRLDAYYAPSPEICEALVNHGLDSSRIHISGIPVRRAFSTVHDKSNMRFQLGWPDIPTVLFITSALGTLGGVDEACNKLVQSNETFRLVIVCGHDTVLLEKLKALSAEFPPGRITVLGFVKNIAQLMSASDVIITKAGGITLSEALSLQRPIVVYRPNPGQEGGNCRWVVDRQAATVARTPQSLRSQVEILLKHPELRLAMSKRAKKLGHPEAAAVIAKDVLSAAAVKLG